MHFHKSSTLNDDHLIFLIKTGNPQSERMLSHTVINNSKLFGGTICLVSDINQVSQIDIIIVLF